MKKYRKEDYEFWDLTKPKVKYKYDERQQKVHNTAFKIMFIVMLILYFADSIVRSNGLNWADNEIGFFICSCAVALIGYIYIIVKDAAIPCNYKNPKYYKWQFLPSFLVSLSIFIKTVGKGLDNLIIIEDNKLNNDFLNIYLFILLIIVCIITMVKYRKKKFSEKEDD